MTQGPFSFVSALGKNGLLTCDRRARIDGSASFVTGAFGLAAAAVVVRTLTEKADQKAADKLLQIGSPIDIDVAADLFDAIESLKQERNAIVLAHYYQEPDMQDIADFVRIRLS